MLTVVLVVLVDLIPFVPRLAFHNATAGGVLDAPATRSVWPGIGYELGLLFCLVALTAGTRARKPVRVLAVVLYAAFLLFSAYHEAFIRLVFFAPTIVDDWRLLLNLMHFLRSSTWLFLASLLPWVLGYLLAIVLAAWTFGRVQRWAGGVSLRARAAVTVLFAIAGAVLIAEARTNPFIQPLGDSVVANVRTSRAAMATWRAIFDAPPDTRYDGFESVPLARRPNVYLLMIEAYGEVLATCESNQAYRDLLGRLEKRFGDQGYHMRSGYSTAPIYGARSWLTMASVQTGIHLDAQPAFRVLERNIARIPTLTKFFKAHGYHTMMLQPLDAPRVGVTSEDIYRRDRAVIRTDLPYKGTPRGLGGVPDQYALGYFEEHFLAGAPQPRFVFYMAVSTHFPWWDTGPYVRDWHKLDGPVGPEDAATWPALAGRATIHEDRLPQYVDSVEYEWRSLADLIDARRGEDALILVIGDHQPRLECGGGPVTFNSPIHVLARDPKLVDLFAGVGLEPGLYAQPGKHEPLKHEGLFSLLVSKLTSIDRPAGAAPPPYVPAGIPLSGLRR